MKIGVLGGTFDPVHIAHLAVAEQARVQLDLDRVVFVPAWIPPHKPANHASAARTPHRIAMLQLALAGNPAFALDTCEISRQGTSYTIDTLRALHAQLGTHAQLHLLIGADNWAIFDTWREPREIMRLCRIAVYPRPGSALPCPSEALHMLEGPAFDLSSSWLRARIAAGYSVRYLVPDPVRDYIAAHHLYTPTEDLPRGISPSS